MRVYNYHSFAKVFEQAITNPNSTNTAQALFEPIVTMKGVVNRAKNPYVIDAHYAKWWNDQTRDIPKPLKIAASSAILLDEIGDYFWKNIIGTVTNPLQEAKMYSELLNLIRNADLDNDKKEELLNLYQEDEKGLFLGRAFLYSLIEDNKKKDIGGNIEPVDEDIAKFKELLKSKYKKPIAIIPPNNIAEHEMRYVEELYKVYHEETGDEYIRPEDLESKPTLKRDFNRQRKDYYKAETINRALRDTIRLDEAEGFSELKEEMYDGIITTRDRRFPSSFDRLTEVMEKATQVHISQNMNIAMLDWVGPGEKKGICHMLVNDKKLKWTEDDEDE